MRYSARHWLTASLAGGLLATAGLPAQAIDYGVDMPDPGIPGYVFPTPETTINQWIAAGNDAEIYKHGWGVWTSLTAPSGVTARNIQNPPVYLTWADPTELAAALQQPDAISFMATSRKSLVLQTPRQSIHGGGQNLMAKEARTADKCGAGGLKDTCNLVTVNFSPSSAKFVYDNKLLLEDTFKAYLQEGYTEVPAFPVDAVNIKPVYKVISPEKLVDGRYYTMPAWPGVDSIAKCNGFKQT